MRRTHTDRRHRSSREDRWIVDAQDRDKSHPKSGRRYLKDLDREIQRFMARVAGVEARSAYYDSDDPSLILEAEEIYREALMLRNEIRECLATGSGSEAGVVDSINDAWSQLRDSFDELKTSLRPERSAGAHPLISRGDEEDNFDLDDLEDDDFENDLESYPQSTTAERRIHRPRGGPKR